MSKTHWKQLINPDYIGAYALPEGQDLTVTITGVGRQIVKGTGGIEQECTVAQLEGQKPFILNVTNSLSIQRLYGPYIEDWTGKKVTLCASTTKLKGEVVECVRIRPQVAQERQPQPITDERLAKAVDSINNGDYSIDKLHKAFKLTSDQVQKLNEGLT